MSKFKKMRIIGAVLGSCAILGGLTGALASCNEKQQSSSSDNHPVQANKGVKLASEKLLDISSKFTQLAQNVSNLEQSKSVEKEITTYINNVFWADQNLYVSKVTALLSRSAADAPRTFNLIISFQQDVYVDKGATKVFKSVDSKTIELVQPVQTLINTIYFTRDFVNKIDKLLQGNLNQQVTTNSGVNEGIAKVVAQCKQMFIDYGVLPEDIVSINIDRAGVIDRKQALSATFNFTKEVELQDDAIFAVNQRDNHQLVYTRKPFVTGYIVIEDNTDEFQSDIIPYADPSEFNWKAQSTYHAWTEIVDNPSYMLFSPIGNKIDERVIRSEFLRTIMDSKQAPDSSSKPFNIFIENMRTFVHPKTNQIICDIVLDIRNPNPTAKKYKLGKLITTDIQPNVPTTIKITIDSTLRKTFHKERMDKTTQLTKSWFAYNIDEVKVQKDSGPVNTIKKYAPTPYCKTINTFVMLPKIPDTQSYLDIRDEANGYLKELNVNQIDSEITNTVNTKYKGLTNNLDILNGIANDILANKTVAQVLSAHATQIGNMIYEFGFNNNPKLSEFPNVFSLILNNKSLPYIYASQSFRNLILSLVSDNFVLKTAIQTIFKTFPDEASFSGAVEQIKNLLPNTTDPKIVVLLDAFNSNMGVLDVALNNSGTIIDLMAGMIPFIASNQDSLKLLLQTVKDTGLNATFMQLIMNLIYKNSPTTNRPVLLDLVYGITHSQAAINILNKFIYNNGNFNEANLREAIRFFATPTDLKGNPISYKTFMDSVNITSWFNNGNPTYDPDSRILNYSKTFRFRFTRDIKWDASKLMKIVPYFDINLGFIHLNDLIKKNFPKGFAIRANDYIDITINFNNTPVLYAVDTFTKQMRWQAYATTKVNLNMPGSMWYAWDATNSPIIDYATKPLWAEALQKISYQEFSLEGYFTPQTSVLEKHKFAKYDPYRLNNNAFFTKMQYGPSQDIKNYVQRYSASQNIAGTKISNKPAGGLKQHDYWKTTSPFTGDLNYVANQLFDLSNMESIDYHVSISTIELLNLRQVSAVPSIKIHKIELHLPTYVYTNDGLMKNSVVYMWVQM